MNIIRAFLLGFQDGKDSPIELTSGFTFESRILNFVYDLGVNLGQLRGKK